MGIRIIGCGAMGSAIAHPLAEQGKEISLYDIDSKKGQQLAQETGAGLFEAPLEGLSSQDDLLLAVKPQDFQTTAVQLKAFEGRLVVSIITGVSIAKLKTAFPNCKVLRMMPNLAVRYGEGMSALAEDPSLAGLKREIEVLFSPLGTLLWIPEENFDAITALIGSGPAFVFAMIEAMVEGAIAMGFSAEKSYDLVMRMVEGSLTLLSKSNQLPGDLKRQVSSPKGTTVHGLTAFEEKKVHSGIIETFLAAYQRAQELSN